MCANFHNYIRFMDKTAKTLMNFLFTDGLMTRKMLAGHEGSKSTMCAENPLSL